MMKDDSPEEQEAKKKQEEIHFSHGFGKIILIPLAIYSSAANAGSFVIGPCGTHYT